MSSPLVGTIAVNMKVQGGSPMPNQDKKTDDLGPSPGPEFVRVRWLKPFVDEKVGGIEWCERRRADGLVLAGHVEVLQDSPAA
jgi:hypothetical protein